MTDADLSELTEKRIDKNPLIKFAFEFLIDYESISSFQGIFNIAFISECFPEFPNPVKQWVPKTPNGA